MTLVLVVFVVFIILIRKINPYWPDVFNGESIWVFWIARILTRKRHDLLGFLPSKVSMSSDHRAPCLYPVARPFFSLVPCIRLSVY